MEDGGGGDQDPGLKLRLRYHKFFRPFNITAMLELLQVSEQRLSPQYIECAADSKNVDF